MELGTELAVVDILSPPFTCWFSRDECPLHSTLVAGLWGAPSGPLTGWTALSAGLVAGAALAGTATLLYYWHWRRRESETEPAQQGTGTESVRDSERHPMPVEV